MVLVLPARQSTWLSCARATSTPATAPSSTFFEGQAEKNEKAARGYSRDSRVGTPKSQLRQFDAALLEKEGWSEVQSGLEAKLRVP